MSYGDYKIDLTGSEQTVNSNNNGGGHTLSHEEHLLRIYSGGEVTPQPMSSYISATDPRGTTELVLEGECNPPPLPLILKNPPKLPSHPCYPGNVGYVIDPVTRPVFSNNDGSYISSDDDVESIILTHQQTLALTDKQKLDGTIPTVQSALSFDSNHPKTMKSRIKELGRCCRNTYYATLCAVLILIGCPMAAVGSQEEISWALYIGITMVMIAFLISILVPNLRFLISLFMPSNIRKHARGIKNSMRKDREKSST